MARGGRRGLAGVAATFSRVAIADRGDFNVTLKAIDRPSDMGGRDLDSGTSRRSYLRRP